MDDLNGGTEDHRREPILKLDSPEGRIALRAMFIAAGSFVALTVLLRISGVFAEHRSYFPIYFAVGITSFPMLQTYLRQRWLHRPLPAKTWLKLTAMMLPIGFAAWGLQVFAQL